MKIVVTGGLGFIGLNFAHFMRRYRPGAQLICIDWHPTQAATVYDTVHRADFGAASSAPIYAGADAVVHLAATTTVQESIADPAASFENNVVKTQRLLDMLRTTAPQTHLVFASTGGAIIGEHAGPIHEAIPPRPVSPYGATKLAVEGLLSAYTGSFGLRAAALRFSNVYGPGSLHKGSVVAAFCKAYLDTGRLTIHGDGCQTRDYVHVADICQAIHKTIATGATGPFQLGTGRATTILELVDALRRIDPDRSLQVAFGPPLPGEVRHNICDISHAAEVLGYAPGYDLPRGLADTLRWFETQRAPRDLARESAA